MVVRFCKVSTFKASMLKHPFESLCLGVLTVLFSVFKKVGGGLWVLLEPPARSQPSGKKKWIESLDSTHIFNIKKHRAFSARMLTKAEHINQQRLKSQAFLRIQTHSNVLFTKQRLGNAWAPKNKTYSLKGLLAKPKAKHHQKNQTPNLKKHLKTKKLFKHIQTVK